MLNKNGERELAYVVIIDEIKPIEGYDRVEYARVGGWWVIVQKNQFKVGDPAIYFEIDSRVPSDRECFAFLEKRNYKIKTLRMCKVISQGLLMHAQDFGWKNAIDADGHPLIYDANDNSVAFGRLLFFFCFSILKNIFFLYYFTVFSKFVKNILDNKIVYLYLKIYKSVVVYVYKQ